MFTLAQKLITKNTFVLLFLGSIHLLYTFRGNKLYPRDTHLERQMQLVSPVLTKQTTMWQAWIGFNASHSYGAIFFGLVYAYLALEQSELLFHSYYLIGVGLALLVGYVVLAFNYWFSVPLIGVVLSTALYVAALVLDWRQ